MSEVVATALLAAYYVVLAALSLYGAHRIRLLWLLWAPAHGSKGASEYPELAELAELAEHLSECTSRSLAHAEGDCTKLPRVTVQLPIYNERFVAPRLLQAVSRFDYPIELLEIQLLDDSTDDTPRLLAPRVEELRQSGYRIQHLRRNNRKGYKAGALAEGLASASGELIAIFDADFVPEPDFLRQTVGHFQDPAIGMVQTTWRHMNRDDSLLTRLQAFFLDGHFLIEHAARARGGLFFNFNGTAGVWRRATIESAGGWQHDTLTEDLDLSYRAQLQGWRFVFLSDIGAPAELPTDLEAFRSQQHRWTHGSAQTLRKLARPMLAAQLPLRTKLEALAHLSSNLCYPFMVLLALLLFPAMMIRHQRSAFGSLAFDGLLFALATLSVVAFYTCSQVRADPYPDRSRLRLWLTTLLLQPPLMALGIGMAPHNAHASLTGLFRRGGDFVRTPKHRQAQGEIDQTYRSAVRLPWPELLMAVYFSVSVAIAAWFQMWWGLPFLMLFLSGYCYTAGLSIHHRTVTQRALARRPKTSDTAKPPGRRLAVDSPATGRIAS